MANLDRTFIIVKILPKMFGVSEEAAIVVIVALAVCGIVLNVVAPYHIRRHAIPAIQILITADESLHRRSDLGPCGESEMPLMRSDVSTISDEEDCGTNMHTSVQRGH
jgi:hypothetical protein